MAHTKKASEEAFSNNQKDYLAARLRAKPKPNKPKPNIIKEVGSGALEE